MKFKSIGIGELIDKHIYSAERPPAYGSLNIKQNKFNIRLLNDIILNNKSFEFCIRYSPTEKDDDGEYIKKYNDNYFMARIEPYDNKIKFKVFNGNKGILGEKDFDTYIDAINYKCFCDNKLSLWDVLHSEDVFAEFRNINNEFYERRLTMGFPGTVHPDEEE